MTTWTLIWALHNGSVHPLVQQVDSLSSLATCLDKAKVVTTAGKPFKSTTACVEVKSATPIRGR